MPTSHVRPESGELLQEIADSLWKAKKVLVVTGAGISTNSGIPDFRSKNGLYSLIQAQFEAAAVGNDEELEDDRDEPASKRRRLSEEDAHANSEDTIEVGQVRVATRRSSRRRGRNSDTDSNSAENDNRNSQSSQSSQNSQGDTISCSPLDPLDDDGSIVVQLPALDPKRFAESLQTPQRRSRSGLSAAGDSIECLGSHPQSSSPLSSPPPILFDPAEEFRTGSTTSARFSSSNSSMAASTCSSSDSESDTEEAPSSSQPVLSSQSSFSSSRSTLPVMKGRELFDASIWADPVKTSVFYTFATTLRQKVREVVPTRSHEFISHLRDTNKLVRCYTQNIDEIEEKVGLTTSLVLGPGKKGRFSTRSASRASLGLLARKDENLPSTQDDGKDQEPLDLASSQESQSSEDGKALIGAAKPTANRDPCFRGVECVFLHGSLRLLRCFRCGQTTPWDEDGREYETMSGRQPSCPRCAGATAAREGRGKRALAVGKLRPDIVLYGEEHPNAHLISPIVQHDISLAPDMLLILGTSLKVHGLKVLIREFSKAVHSRGGKVVFVNFTKPPESVWSDIIDYWVQWDCDAWVQDLKEKKPVMWLPPGSVVEEPKKKRKSVSAATKGGKRSSEGANEKVTGETMPADETKEEEKKKRQPKVKKEKLSRETKVEAAAEAAGTGEKRPPGRAINPNAKPLVEVPDDTANGAFVAWKIRKELDKAFPRSDEATSAKPARAAPGERKPRHSAPADMENVFPARPELELSLDRAVDPSTMPAVTTKQSPAPLPTFHFLEPIVSRVEPSLATNIQPPSAKQLVIDIATVTTSSPAASPTVPENYSILSAVKANPRRRQSKKIFEIGGGKGPVVVQAQAAEPKQPRKQSKPRERSKSMGDPILPCPEPATPVARASMRETAWSDTDRLAEQLMMELNSHHPQPTEPAKTETAPRISLDISPDSSPSTVALTQTPSPPHIPLTPPFHVPESNVPLTASPPQIRPLSNTTELPPIWQVFPELQPRRTTDNAFFLQDPLAEHYGFPPPFPQECSCTDQLRREADEVHRRRSGQ